MAESLKYLSCKHENLSLVPRTRCKKWWPCDTWLASPGTAGQPDLIGQFQVTETLFPKQKHVVDGTWARILEAIIWPPLTGICLHIRTKKTTQTHTNIHTQRQFKHYIHICICLKCIIFTSGIYQEVILALLLMVPDSYHLYNALWPLLLIILLSVTVDGCWFATDRSHPAVNPPLDASLLCSSLQDEFLPTVLLLNIIT